MPRRVSIVSSPISESQKSMLGGQPRRVSIVSSPISESQKSMLGGQQTGSHVQWSLVEFPLQFSDFNMLVICYPTSWPLREMEGLETQRNKSHNCRASNQVIFRHVTEILCRLLSSFYIHELVVITQQRTRTIRFALPAFNNSTD